jgi:hypothetical protein
MGDGGDGGDAVDFAAAELPVDYGSEVVESAAGDAEDAFDDVIVTGGSAGGRLESEEADVIELTWVEPDTHSGS